jgi:hypothetical protein
MLVFFLIITLRILLLLPYISPFRKKLEIIFILKYINFCIQWLLIIVFIWLMTCSVMLFCVLLRFLNNIESLRRCSSRWSSHRINFLKVLLMIQISLNNYVLDQMTKVLSLHWLVRIVVKIEIGLH